MKNTYYVYAHRRKSDNEIFYVGKGKADRAFLGGKKRSLYWNNMANKHGFFVEIAFDKLSEKEAFDLEKEAIASCKLIGCPLVNLTEGGEGMSNPSIETRKKLSIASSSRVLSDESKAKISASKLGKPRTKETKLKLSIACSNPSQETRAKMTKAALNRSPETIAKLSASHKGKKHSAETRAKMSSSRIKRLKEAK